METIYEKFKRLSIDDCKGLFQGITVDNNGYTILLGIPNVINVYNSKTLPKDELSITKSKKLVRTRFINVYDKHYKFNRPSISKLFTAWCVPELKDKVLVELHIDNLDRIRVSSTRSENTEVCTIFIDNKPSLFYISGDVILISELVRTKVIDNTINAFNTIGVIYDLDVDQSLIGTNTIKIISSAIILLAHNNELYNVDIQKRSIELTKSDISKFDKMNYVKTLYNMVESRRVQYSLESFDIQTCINKGKFNNY